MKRLMMAMIVGLAGWARADGISIGYGTIPLQREYVVTNVGLGTAANAEDTFSPSQIQVVYTLERKAFNKIAMTLTTGVGLPMSSVKFDLGKEYTNVPAVSNKNALNSGDSEEVSVLTVPVLVGARYLIPMGDNSLTLGLSVGAMLIGADTTITDQKWTGPPGTQSANGSVVTYTSAVAPAYAILGSVAYHIKTGDGESIAITVPLGSVSEVRMDTVSTTPGATPVTTDDGWKAGGFVFGLQVGWFKSF